MQEHGDTWQAPLIIVPTGRRPQRPRGMVTRRMPGLETQMWA